METILVAEHAPLTWQAGAAVVVAGLIAPFPDMDLSVSWVSQHVPFVGQVSRFVRHRTLTHSLLLSTIIYLLLFIVFTGTPRWLATGILVGWVSHWLIDLINPMGVQLFYPFRFQVKPPIEAISIAVNGVGEAIIRTLLKIYVVAVLVLYVGVSLPFVPPHFVYLGRHWLAPFVWSWLGVGAKWLGVVL